MRIINKTYNIKGNIDKNIVLISDIHYTNKKDIKHLNKVLDNIKKIKPNYICIPGDITDRTYINDEDYFVDWLNKLSKICKVIISIGNHEFCISKKEQKYGFNEDLYKKIKAISNLYVLDNENVLIDNINFMGVTLPYEYYYCNKEHRDSKYFNKLNISNKNYNVLLCHSPFSITNDLNVDLILCGHTHGGIIPNFLRFIFKNNGLISPQKTLFPKNVYGNIKNSNTDIIITSGISVLPRKMGILKNLMASEIVNIKIY